MYFRGNMAAERAITIYHSPDADDAFMFYGLSSGAVSVPGYRFEHELSDIEGLNQRALRGELEVTAVSVHAYARIAERYRILRCGASMGGEHYGPKVVARSLTPLARSGARIAIPGELTSAALALKIFLREQGIDAELVNTHFDQVQHRVRDGSVDAGVIIHEGQLTHEREGLACVVDLGVWWWRETGLPLPLGVNVVRRDLGDEASRAVFKALKGSIEYSLEHRSKAIEYALRYGRGISASEADVFVGMYVNEVTLDIGEKGMRSIELFLERGARHGLIAGVVPEFVGG